MTVFMNYDAVGNRECLLEQITNISPMDTPFQNRISKVSVTGVHPEWQTDSLRAATANAQEEGFSWSAATVVPTEKLDNYTQILAHGYSVSDTQEAVLKAGRSSEVAYQKSKALKEIARDLEKALVDNDTSTSHAGSNAGKLLGLKGFMVEATGIYNVDVSAALTVDSLNSALQAVWIAGATEMNAIYVQPKQKLKMDAFGSAVRSFPVGAEKYGDLISIYESNFGTFELVMTRVVANSELYALKEDAWHLGVLRGMKSNPVPKTGSRTTFMIEGEVTLIADNPKTGVRLHSLS